MTTRPESPARAFRNPAAAPPSEPYGPVRSRGLRAEGFVVAFQEISGWPGYAATPLAPLPSLARALGLGMLWYKDERPRFGLKSFKALGGAYAVANVLRAKVAEALGREVFGGELVDGSHAALVAKETVTCATDGNHGRSVAWGARLFGCRCVIYVHETVSQGRRDAIAAYGAEVVEVKGTYDDAVRHAAAQAAAHGWTVVSDTSYPGYTAIPTDVMHGYGVMAEEVAAQLGDVPPTHVLVQAGVGAFAGAMCANFWIRWGERRPRFVVVEPLEADCIYRSLEAGHPVVVGGALDTAMAGLACGEVSELAWPILSGGANAAVAIGDEDAFAAMRLLANPVGGDPAIVSGETGGAGLGALIAAKRDCAIREAMALGPDSRVLLLGSEGDTDPVIYRHIVGRSAEEVLA
jgi:diaminopropionate ammonia-lyase